MTDFRGLGRRVKLNNLTCMWHVYIQVYFITQSSNWHKKYIMSVKLVRFTKVQPCSTVIKQILGIEYKKNVDGVRSILPFKIIEIKPIYSNFSFLFPHLFECICFTDCEHSVCFWHVRIIYIFLLIDGVKYHSLLYKLVSEL